MSTFPSPKKPALDGGLNRSPNSSQILKRSISVKRKRLELKENIKWLAINILLLAILLYDLYYTCPMNLTYYNYVEFSLTIILTVNVIYYFLKILKYLLIFHDQIPVTLEQKKLLKVEDEDPNYTLISPSKTLAKQSSPPTTPVQSASPFNLTNLSWRSNAATPSSQQGTPLNMSALSWRSNPTQDDQMDYSSHAWSYRDNAEEVTQADLELPSRRYRGRFDDEDDNDKAEYDYKKSELDETETKEEREELENLEAMQLNRSESYGLLNSFWSHSFSKSARDLSSVLNVNQYQLSTQSPTKGGSPLMKPEDKSSNYVPAIEVWKGIRVDVTTLIQWNENLRMWISQTILERLVKEIDTVNAALEKHNMSDMKIGNVGLDRLRKAALMSQVTHIIPSIPAIIPFLEVHPNQEYVVKRIRELSNGGCMSQFQWNGGGSFRRKDWDDTLPTDSAIIMHCLSSYMDTQLLPSPNRPDAKAFSGRYFLKTTDQFPYLTPHSLFIQEMSEKPPHYRVIVGEKIYEIAKGYNNLFQSILFFIYNVHKMEQGMLGRVNLGRAGLNMLWIVGLND